jgi:hypothetical protein
MITAKPMTCFALHQNMILTAEKRYGVWNSQNFADKENGPLPDPFMD